MIRIIQGDCRDVLKTLPDASVQCCVTSPPYFGLRNYGVAGQIGLEPSPDEFIAELVAVFREVRRVLLADGTCWLNLGDCYSSGNSGQRVRDTSGGFQLGLNTREQGAANANPGRSPIEGMKPKDLLMIPARVAIALQADGWWLRSDIIWVKPNPMPESVTDRPTSSHEHVFLLTKSARYFFDADAVREDVDRPELAGKSRLSGVVGLAGQRGDVGRQHAYCAPDMKRNIRNVWTIATQPYAEAHFATFPPELAERCIKAGSREGDTILDPFSGAGTTALVADRLRRDAIGIELNPAYTALSTQRITADAGLFAEVSA